MYYEQVADKQLRKSEDAAPISPAANISGMSPGPADLVELEVSTVFSSLSLNPMPSTPSNGVLHIV